MSDEKEKLTPVFIMVPRKLIIAWISTFICVIIIAVSTIQYANFIDSRSNKRWCGIVNMYNDEFAKNPPPSTLGQNLIREFKQLQNDFHCK